MKFEDLLTSALVLLRVQFSRWTGFRPVHINVQVDWEHLTTGFPLAASSFKILHLLKFL